MPDAALAAHAFEGEAHGAERQDFFALEVCQLLNGFEGNGAGSERPDRSADAERIVSRDIGQVGHGKIHRLADSAAFLFHICLQFCHRDLVSLLGQGGLQMLRQLARGAGL